MRDSSAALLTIRETSLLHRALMLFEGENSQIKIDLDNIGNIPVDFVTLSFSGRTTTNLLPIRPEPPVEEVYDVSFSARERLYFHRKVLVKMWQWQGSIFASR